MLPFTLFLSLFIRFLGRTIYHATGDHPFTFLRSPVKLDSQACLLFRHPHPRVIFQYAPQERFFTSCVRVYVLGSVHGMFHVPTEQSADCDFEAAHDSLG